jgi:hypothetical protein
VRVLKKAEFGTGLRRPTFYETGIDTNGAVLIVDNEDLKRLLDDRINLANTLLISVEKPVYPLKLFEGSILLLAEGISVQALFNELQGIFDLFDTWDETMKHIFYENGSFQDLIDSCDLVMDEWILLVDQKFHYVAFSKACELAFDPSVIDEHHNMPCDAVNDFISDSGFQELYDVPEVFDYVAVTPSGNEEMICKNFFEDDSYTGRVIVSLVSGQDDVLKNYVRRILECFFDYASRLYKKYQSFDEKKGILNSLRLPLINFLHGQKNPEGLWEQAASENGWQNSDRLQLVQLRSQASYTKNIYHEFLGSEIEKQWQGSVCLMHKERLLILINLDRFESADEQDFHRCLPVFLRESLLVAGLSREFGAVSQLNAAYEQTEVALDFGIGQASTHWIHQFDDYAFAYMLKSCTGNFLEHQICSEKLLAVKKYDEEKHTEYYKTLSVYFQCRLNAAATAKKLFIHRSSLLNRLDRLTELFEINLDSNEEILYLGLSWLVMERNRSL